MMIIGVDYHPSFQQIAFLVEETGECGERRLNHSDGEAENFYRDLKARGISVRVGMETTGCSRWLERVLAELGFEVWIGDAAESKTRRAKKQKTDRQDAQLLLKLLLEERFPRIWVPSPENRDLRQLLWHRHRLVQMRTAPLTWWSLFRLEPYRKSSTSDISGLTLWLGFRNQCRARRMQRDHNDKGRKLKTDG